MICESPAISRQFSVLARDVEFLNAGIDRPVGLM
jgi:hypothetical protein